RSGRANRCQETGRAPGERAHVAASRRRDAGVQSREPLQHAAGGAGAATDHSRFRPRAQLEFAIHAGDEICSLKRRSVPPPKRDQGRGATALYTVHRPVAHFSGDSIEHTALKWLSVSTFCTSTFSTISVKIA